MKRTFASAKVLLSILLIPTQPFGEGAILILGLLLGIVLQYYLKRPF